ncbi:hypothetical protein ALC62_15988 [Cyphomyrmex costatus]|uniref:HAT C-terminal dimerisation domain-containing protein n=1 Tax=Cyphomyrmex costatus TaxID=456900 RepID=A0A151I677_9HYME|nr:hypothetical protein ALC62_15988 [Cyphomyrmex costatus]
MLDEFSKLIRILITIPVTSCIAERSFSALRKLKTYTRSTMRQGRLNHIAILHVCTSRHFRKTKFKRTC